MQAGSSLQPGGQRKGTPAGTARASASEARDGGELGSAACRQQCPLKKLNAVAFPHQEAPKRGPASSVVESE